MKLGGIDHRSRVTEDVHSKKTWLLVRDPIRCMYVTVAMVTESYMVLPYSGKLWQH